ncbi:hypothetical protein QQF64_001786 [Cirrhinus molitorella]|uniref:Uncharacterized protein n=1 Tax=Cirrhinus molitorella TaxID=172907 RepID=A0ABR3MNA4_9TELE
MGQNNNSVTHKAGDADRKVRTSLSRGTKRQTEGVLKISCCSESSLKDAGLELKAEDVRVDLNGSSDLNGTSGLFTEYDER